MKKLLKKYSYLGWILLGAFILAFGMYNIHSRTVITEGGIWGIELLIDHWFGISPAFTAPFLDGACYLMGVVFLGKVGVGISEEHLRKGRYEVYDKYFLLLDDEEDFVGRAISFPQTLCVSVRFRGSHNEAPEQYRRLNEYIEDHDLEINGFSREITMIDYGITSDTEKFVTEISIPVASS